MGDSIISLLDHRIFEQQFLHHDTVESIQGNWFDHSCKVKYLSTKEVVCHVDIDGYNSQYGTPVDPSGKYILIGHWDYHDGLCCYDIHSDTLMWRKKLSKIRAIFTEKDYVIVTQASTAIHKLDLKTGEILGEIKSSSIENAHRIDCSHILVSWIKGKIGIIDIDTLEICKLYPQKVINPNDCLLQYTLNAYYENGQLILDGFEMYPNRIYQENAERIYFKRILPMK